MEINKFFVKVKTRAKQAGVVRIDKDHFEVAVTAAPEKGLANRAVLKALAEYLDMPVSRFSIVSGAAWRNKIIEIE